MAVAGQRRHLLVHVIITISNSNNNLLLALLLNSLGFRCALRDRALLVGIAGGETARSAEHSIALHAGRTGCAGHLTIHLLPAGGARVAAYRVWTRDSRRRSAAHDTIADKGGRTGGAGVAAEGSCHVPTGALLPARVSATVVNICNKGIS